ncbi:MULTISPECIES: WecB/TagA/CpsF family glycosyltransferase [Paenibacillus]|uniref:Teichoic acid biosynthesis protein n=2 Tax=Paenibacillus polymyxa TaxID=1406 RepID=E3EGX5_PAEPS|nr:MULTISPECIES: WecB/TagA/CpsF family glycosyltransferase [Paenibacillus]ADO55209.1 teichoic acid biosynthesis protein [Paenibacillus polymyxa SC2]MBU9707191.1 WecB/TagA/CpsF family glycosyltransferase [Paenibacillus sp. AK121]MEE4566235.1 WecB/TagA/CpsF family glycosyltransferase [Paenibacillus polymyxa]TKH38742.1 glycosyltransferase [Paenibacillus polymyxa]WPQ58020.1 WecB/TagA/CpsF family glycosyltransferase [Paenibacillus polymyxa]
MMKQLPQYRVGRIASTDVAALTFQETVHTLEQWAVGRKDSYVCICNTHSIVTAGNQPEFHEALTQADLCTPDGMPLVWALKLYGFERQDRVDGPSLMLKLCERAPQTEVSVYFYGSTPDTLDSLKDRIGQDYPGIRIAGSFSPPFRELQPDEEKRIIEEINASGAHIIFVSLGCPKQEVWMHRNKDRIRGVMIGVGAAFDYITGKVRRPPLMIQRLGLEWLYRLICEPKRLWKRYAYNNPMYIYRFLKSYRHNKRLTLYHNRHTGRGIEK